MCSMVGHLPRWVVHHVAMGHAAPLQSGQPGRFTFQDCLQLTMAMRDKMNSFSLQYWYRCVGCAEPWSMEVVSRWIQGRLTETTEDGEDLSTLMIQAVDIAPQLAREQGLSCMDIRKGGLEPLLFGLLLAVP